MYLKRLEMVGFKSFAERTRLEFEPGITAIVGPNGCGKSNVVDALRWCLGEMSAKSLRSKMLVDVIFNGSANRVPSNLAEVSLTFDNSQNRLPIDYSEVTITRRLFRSGESEYFLNKTQCRLKDIRELFLDTGIGEEGYSIMEQGRVEYILNARPEERRELFEEAAGVSKYKARREEALRKMERTQMDLDRLSDVIAMTKEQMDKIEAAVRKAKQYQKLHEDLKTLEVTHWLWDVTQLTEQIVSMEQALQVIEADLQQKTVELNQKEAQLTEQRWQETQIGEKLVELNKQISEIDGAISLAEQRQATAREREGEIRHRDMVLDSELSQGRSRLAELSRLREEFKAALEEERRSAQESEEGLRREEAVHQEKSARLQELEARAKALQDALWQNNHERTHLHNEIASQRSLETRLEMQQAVHQKDRAKAEERIRTTEASLDDTRRSYDAWQKEMEGLEQKAEHARAALQEADARLAEISQRAIDLQTALTRAQAQLEAQEEWESSDVYFQGVRSILTAALPGIQGPLGKLLTVASGDENIVRQALGSHINDLVAETLEDAQAAIQFLASQGKGRARIIVRNRLPAPSSTPAADLGQRSVLGLVKADEPLQPVLNFLLGPWIASGSTLYGEGMLEGGSDLTPPPGFDSLRRENLLKEISQHQETLRSVQDQRSQQDTLRRALSAEWETARQGLESARGKGKLFLHEMERLESHLELVHQEVQLIDGEMEKVKQEEQRAEETAQALSKRLEDLKSQEDNLKQEWQSLRDTLQTRQSEALVASADLAVARERASSHQERIQWREKQLGDIETELSGLNSSLESKTQERAGSLQRVEEQQSLQKEAQQTIESFMAKRQEINARLEAVHSDRQTLHERLTEIQNALADLRELTDQMRTQLQDKKLQHNHAQFRKESAETQLKEKYGLALSDAQQTYGLPEQPPAAAELDRLRRRVENMGPVNLAAPEEHAELEQRYNFLLSQQQDLVKAKEDLMQTIQKINAATRLNFRETFDKVRENFKAIYGQLFQGGESDLRFTDEADLLNTGIEIFAQPPGKKLQSIVLLSGGEKALTAVALLFAFFMVRPSPFAVLDEVDAPLDEANVTRFITLIKTFTHQSQFLMITHNKRTMETADTLYGVTMETLGVSRILSARLRNEAGNGKTASPESVIAAEEK
jgi:chromosome segregation protein